jgi:hypothetical protein
MIQNHRNKGQPRPNPPTEEIITVNGHVYTVPIHLPDPLKWVEVNIPHEDQSAMIEVLQQRRPR